jgi:hypothetical protein
VRARGGSPSNPFDPVDDPAMSLPAPFTSVNSLTFDLMGTCLDWHSSILTSLRDHAPSQSSLDLSALAHNWRLGFFTYIISSFDKGEQGPDIDMVHRIVLDKLIQENGEGNIWTEEVRKDLVHSWHRQVGELIFQSDGMLI